MFQLWGGTCLLAVDAHVSTCGPKVSTCNPRAQTRCVSKHITHTDAHCTYSQIHTKVYMQTLCHTHTVAHTHRNKQAKSLFNTQTYTQTQKVRRTDCIATIRHNRAQLVGGEEWRGARDAAEENCQRSVEGTWDLEGKNRSETWWTWPISCYISSSGRAFSVNVDKGDRRFLFAPARHLNL